MTKMVNEIATVANSRDGLLVIRHDRSWDDGVNMGGDLICEASAAGWLADHIEAASEPYGAPDIDQEMPPDHFVVFTRGGEHGEDINVHVYNRRDPGAPLGRIYTLSGISPRQAKNIAAQLRALKPQ